MLFDREVKVCKECGIPTLVDNGEEYGDGFVCDFCYEKEMGFVPILGRNEK